MSKARLKISPELFVDLDEEMLEDIDEATSKFGSIDSRIKNGR